MLSKAKPGRHAGAVLANLLPGTPEFGRVVVDRKHPPKIRRNRDASKNGPPAAFGSRLAKRGSEGLVTVTN